MNAREIKLLAADVALVCFIGTGIAAALVRWWTA
jgi:hypothetical protein